jgi:hypothetical protein
MSLQPERIAQLCELLKLPAIHSEWPAFAQRAAQEESSFADFLEAVLGAERSARTERVRATLLRLATLPAVKTLESYDFSFATGAERLDPPHKLGDASAIEPTENPTLAAHENASGPAAAELTRFAETWKTYEAAASRIVAQEKALLSFGALLAAINEATPRLTALADEG